MSIDHLISDSDIKKSINKNQPEIMVHNDTISCPDILSLPENRHHIQQKHPRVIIKLSEQKNKQVCYYCGNIYRYQSQ